MYRRRAYVYLYDLRLTKIIWALSSCHVTCLRYNSQSMWLPSFSRQRPLIATAKRRSFVKLQSDSRMKITIRIIAALAVSSVLCVTAGPLHASCKINWSVIFIDLI